MAPLFGYWNFRGFGQPICLLLAYTGTEYEHKRYNLPFVNGDYDMSEWLNEKFNLGMAFPNLPYYIDDDVKLSQTLAILKYLARKNGLVATNEQEQIRVDLIEAEGLDIRAKWVQLAYSPEFEKLKEEYLKNLAKKLNELSTFLGDGKWFAGDNITHVDFLLYELLDLQLHLEPTVLDDFANLKAFLERMRSQEKMAAYFASDKCIKYPLTGPMATFGGK